MTSYVNPTSNPLGSFTPATSVSTRSVSEDIGSGKATRLVATTETKTVVAHAREGVHSADITRHSTDRCIKRVNPFARQHGGVGRRNEIFDGQSELKGLKRKQLQKTVSIFRDAYTLLCTSQTF